MAQILEIDNLNAEVAAPSHLNHFEYHSGGEIQSDIVIEQDNITPYCFDHATQQLICVEIPDDLDLRTVPFVYSTQRENAIRLIAVPYAELPDLASRVALPEKMVFIFSTGRAGSTLMNQILNEVDGVSSLSEPDVFLNLVQISNQGNDRESLSDLLAQCYRLLVKSYSDNTIAIKHRGECIEIADIFYKAFPEAKNLFMYRNAEAWAASWRRIFLDLGIPDEMPIDQARQFLMQMIGKTDPLDRYIAPDQQFVTISSGMATIWMYFITAYLNAYEQNIPFLTLRYQDINTNREHYLTRIFEYIGLPADQVEQALQGFERDSQAGTALERKHDEGNTVDLDEANARMVRDMLAKHPEQLTPDVILPGTTTL